MASQAFKRNRLAKQKLLQQASESAHEERGVGGLRKHSQIIINDQRSSSYFDKNASLVVLGNSSQSLQVNN